MLANWLEFRAAIFPVQNESTIGGVDSKTGGTEDTYLGFKIVAVQFFNWKLVQTQGRGFDISREWIQKPRQARVTATG
jgi:hypothetical protein